jgi:hypothetical protein
MKLPATIDGTYREPVPRYEKEHQPAQVPTL